MNGKLLLNQIALYFTITCLTTGTALGIYLIINGEMNFTMMVRAVFGYSIGIWGIKSFNNSIKELKRKAKDHAAIQSGTAKDN